MSPKNKAKAAGISASSFFDLKAELAKQENDFAKNKAAGKSNAMIVGGIKRPDKVLRALVTLITVPISDIVIPETNYLGSPE